MLSYKTELPKKKRRRTSCAFFLHLRAGHAPWQCVLSPVWRPLPADRTSRMLVLLPWISKLLRSRGWPGPSRPSQEPGTRSAAPWCWMNGCRHSASWKLWDALVPMQTQLWGRAQKGINPRPCSRAFLMSWPEGCINMGWHTTQGRRK